MNDVNKIEHLQKWRQDEKDHMRTKALERLGIVEPQAQEPLQEDIQFFIDCAKRVGVRFVP